MVGLNVAPRATSLRLRTHVVFMTHVGPLTLTASGAESRATVARPDSVSRAHFDDSNTSNQMSKPESRFPGVVTSW